MLRNYFMVAMRNLKRNFSYSTINVFGLALGITCSLILFLLISFFTSFDQDHPNGDRIYRITSVRSNNGLSDYQAGVAPVMPEALRSDITGLQDVLFMSYRDQGLIALESKGETHRYREKGGIVFTEANLFKFFNRKIVAGAVGDFNQPNQAIISEELAKKYFGDESPLGRILRLDNQYDIVVVAVVNDFSDNTNFPFGLIISYKTILDEKERYGWNSVDSNDQCYVLLNADLEPGDIESQFPGFMTKYLGTEKAERTTFSLQPLSEIMFNDQYSNFRYRTIKKESLWAMGVVAIFLLFTACINFINLSTAVAVKRSKEVGIRKVMGSQRGQLMLQYFCETGLIAFVALVISVGLAEIGLIQLNSFFETNLHIDVRSAPQLFFIGLVWLFVTLASGLYPAMLLSGFSPAVALKNKITGTGTYSLRRTLVVFQFMISQILIVGTIIMLMQMNYFANKDLGFVKDAVITVPIYDSKNVAKKKVLKKEIDRLAGVRQSSLCLEPPSSESTYNTRFRIEGGAEEGYRTQILKVDGDYLNMFQIPVLAGRDLLDLDSANGWVVNETLAKTVGYTTPETIVGRIITIGKRSLPVLGVVRDFHTVSLNNEIYPTILFNDPEAYYNIAVQLKAGEFSKTISEIEKLWNEQYNDYLFSYQFLDESLSKFYDRERKLSTLLIIFASIAILIGCLGLYGLISYMANEKEKEIGVRKVLGASSGQIMFIFSKELLILVLVSFVIASPIAGYVMNGWLQNFAYHIDLNWSMFGAGIIVTLIIAFATVGYRTLKAANTNPVNTLRSE